MVLDLDEAFDRQVLVLESELWRAISSQEEATNMLCSKITEAHLKVFRETHSKLDAQLDTLERQELQLRELAVLDEFQKRIHEAIQAMQKERTLLEHMVGASRDTFAESLKTQLEENRQLRRQSAKDDDDQQRSTVSHGSSGRKNGPLRSVLKLFHRVVVTGVTAFLSVEAIKIAKKFDENQSRIRRTRYDPSIHTLPSITIPHCGTRDVVMQ